VAAELTLYDQAAWQKHQAHGPERLASSARETSARRPRERFRRRAWVYTVSSDRQRKCSRGQPALTAQLLLRDGSTFDEQHP